MDSGINTVVYLIFEMKIKTIFIKTCISTRRFLIVIILSKQLFINKFLFLNVRLRFIYYGLP